MTRRKSDLGFLRSGGGTPPASRPRSSGADVAAPKTRSAIVFRGFQQASQSAQRSLADSTREFLRKRGMTPVGEDPPPRSPAGQRQQGRSLVSSMRAFLERRGMTPNEPQRG